MPHSELRPKTRRIIANDLELLFSPRALLADGLDTIMALGARALFRELKYGNGSLFLSDDGAAALRRLTNSIFQMPSLAGIVSESECATEVKKHYNDWLQRHLQPDGHEFVDPVIAALIAKVRHYQFLTPFTGIDLKDQDALELGTVRIQRPDNQLFDSVHLGEVFDKERLSQEFGGALWLVGQARGSPDVALERFELQVSLTIGILAICGALLYEGAIWRSRVRGIVSSAESEKPVSLLRWEDGNDRTALSRRGGRGQDLPLGTQSIRYLTDQCFLQQMGQLINAQDRTELQDAIVRAIYWIGDAYKDRNSVMQFVKLWSCVECFFAISEEKITDANAKGIASTLVFGGFRVVEPSEYTSTKRRVKYLYGLRSKALHRAHFGHVEISDLNELSSWTAWIIVTMVGLSQRGYKTLQQVRDQVLRIDKNSSPRERTDTDAHHDSALGR